MYGNPTATTPPGPRGPRSDRVVLSRPSALHDPFRQSDHLRPTSRYPGYRDGLWHSRVILPGRQTFRTFTTTLSRIAAISFRRESGTCSSVLPHRHWPSGRGKKPLATPMHPPISFTWDPFRRLVSSLSLRPSWLLASWADQTDGAQCLPGLPRLLLPGFQPSSHPDNCRVSLRRQTENCAGRTFTCKCSS